MTKEVFQSFIDTAKANGVTEYTIRAENANRIVPHNDDSGRIVLGDDHITCIELSRNYQVEGTRYIITVITYDTIDSVILQDIDVATSIKIMTALGMFDADMEKFFKQAPVRRDLKPGTAGLAVRTDSDGNPVVATGSVGYVTHG
jgi:hypothetical protein